MSNKNFFSNQTKSTIFLIIFFILFKNDIFFIIKNQNICQLNNNNQYYIDFFLICFIFLIYFYVVFTLNDFVRKRQYNNTYRIFIYSIYLTSFIGEFYIFNTRKIFLILTLLVFFLLSSYERNTNKIILCEIYSIYLFFKSIISCIDYFKNIDTYYKEYIFEWTVFTFIINNSSINPKFRELDYSIINNTNMTILSNSSTEIFSSMFPVEKQQIFQFLFEKTTKTKLVLCRKTLNPLYFNKNIYQMIDIDYKPKDLNEKSNIFDFSLLTDDEKSYFQQGLLNFFHDLVQCICDKYFEDEIPLSLYNYLLEYQIGDNSDYENTIYFYSSQSMQFHINLKLSKDYIYLSIQSMKKSALFKNIFLKIKSQILLTIFHELNNPMLALNYLIDYWPECQIEEKYTIRKKIIRYQNFLKFQILNFCLYFKKAFQSDILLNQSNQISIFITIGSSLNCIIGDENTYSLLNGIDSERLNFVFLNSDQQYLELFLNNSISYVHKSTLQSTENINFKLSFEYKPINNSSLTFSSSSKFTLILLFKASQYNNSNKENLSLDDDPSHEVSINSIELHKELIIFLSNKLSFKVHFSQNDFKELLSYKPEADYSKYILGISFPNCFYNKLSKKVSLNLQVLNETGQLINNYNTSILNYKIPIQSQVFLKDKKICNLLNKDINKYSKTPVLTKKYLISKEFSLHRVDNKKLNNGYFNLINGSLPNNKTHTSNIVNSVNKLNSIDTINKKTQYNYNSFDAKKKICKTINSSKNTQINKTNYKISNFIDDLDLKGLSKLTCFAKNSTMSLKNNEKVENKRKNHTLLNSFFYKSDKSVEENSKDDDLFFEEWTKSRKTSNSNSKLSVIVGDYINEKSYDEDDKTNEISIESYQIQNHNHLENEKNKINTKSIYSINKEQVPNIVSYKKTQIGNSKKATLASEINNKTITNKRLKLLKKLNKSNKDENEEEKDIFNQDNKEKFYIETYNLKNKKYSYKTRSNINNSSYSEVNPHILNTEILHSKRNKIFNLHINNYKNTTNTYNINYIHDWKINITNNEINNIVNRKNKEYHKKKNFKDKPKTCSSEKSNSLIDFNKSKTSLTSKFNSQNKSLIGFNMIFKLCKVNNEDDYYNKSFNRIDFKLKIPHAFTSNCYCNDILIVDDESINVKALKFLLKKQNLNADTCSNGLEAVNKVKESFQKSCCDKIYKIMFFDLMMPIMKGDEASEIISNIYKSKGINDYLNIIVISAHESSYVMETLKKVICFKMFIPKPPNRKTIEDVIYEFYLNGISFEKMFNYSKKNIVNQK